jgi:hypothetical protein
MIRGAAQKQITRKKREGEKKFSLSSHIFFALSFPSKIHALTGIEHGWVGGGRVGRGFSQEVGRWGWHSDLRWAPSKNVGSRHAGIHHHL